MEFKKKVEAKKNAYSGEAVKDWLGKAYETGIQDLAIELNIRFEKEAEINQNTRAGLLRAIGILSEIR
jgi:hypothetical protein